MSRDSILDDAIAKAKADGDVELAEWLRITRGAEKAVRWYTTRVKELEDFACRIEECAKRREPVTLFGVNYVDAQAFDVAARLVAKLDVENRKLREVVRAMMICWDDDCDEKTCPMYVADIQGRCKLAYMLKELGIEG